MLPRTDKINVNSEWEEKKGRDGKNWNYELQSSMET